MAGGERRPNVPVEKGDDTPVAIHNCDDVPRNAVAVES